MIPIRDHTQTRTKPIVTYLLIGINALVFLAMISLPASQMQAFVNRFSVIPQEIANGQDWFTILTSMFLHGSIGHLVSNMLFLNIFGDNLEDRLGHLTYLGFYLLCGLGASALQILIDPTVTIPNLGASGAIAGLLGAYLVLYPNHPIEVLFSYGFLMRRATVPAFTMLIYWIFAQFISGFGQLAVAGSDGVAYFAHIGGFFTGLGLIKVEQNIKQTNN